MKTETIYLENQTILISDEVAGFTYNKPTWNSDRKIGLPENNRSRIIIAASPKLSDLPLLPLPDDDIEKLALIEYPVMLRHFNNITEGYGSEDTNLFKRSIFIKGLRAAKQNSFTKDDMRWAYFNYDGDDMTEEGFNKMLNTLDQKPKPQFIPEMEEVGGNNKTNSFDEKQIYYQQPKIVDGKIIGRWK